MKDDKAEVIGDFCVKIGGGSTREDRNSWKYWIAVNSANVNPRVCLGYFEEKKSGEEKGLKKLYEISEENHKENKTKIEEDSKSWERTESERIKRILLDRARLIIRR